MILPDMGETLAIEVKCVAPVAARLGEGPIWDPRTQRLLFLDIKGGKLFAFDPSTGGTKIYDAPRMVSALGLRKRGGYICACRDGFAYLSLDEGKVLLESLVDPEIDRPDNRFNDGKVDPAGGFWAGTMDDNETSSSAGSWWRLAPDGGVDLLDQGFHVTNGPAFDESRERVYFTDSARRVIYAATSTGGAFREKKAFLTFGDGDGYPDGMDIDRNGDLWVAFWDGGAIRRFSPDGTRLEEIAIPAARPTSVALVGDRAYVTSARIGLGQDALAERPQSGGLFEIRLRRQISAPPRYFAG